MGDLDLSATLIRKLEELTPGPDLAGSVRSLITIVSHVKDQRELRDFLEGSNAISQAKLESILGKEKHDELMNTGLIHTEGTTDYLLIKCLNINGKIYCTDSSQTNIHRKRLSFDPAHYNAYILKQIKIIKDIISERTARSYLEMGTGVGIIAMEMTGLVQRSLGLEIYNRNLEFAFLNKKLNGNSEIEFKESDLFSSTMERFDCISFYPWAPTENSIDLVKSFLTSSPAHMTDNGCVVLITESYSRHGERYVDEVVSDCLRMTGLCATKRILETHFFSHDNKLAIGRMSLFTIEQRGKNRRLLLKIKHIGWLKRIVWVMLLPIRKILFELAKLSA